MNRHQAHNQNIYTFGKVVGREITTKRKKRERVGVHFPRMAIRLKNL